MQAPHLIPASCDDTVRDVADGSTFYLEPHNHPRYAGHAFIASDEENSAKDGRLCMRLLDGRALFLPKHWACRVVALVAETSGDQW